jgi:hypothetical protein
MKQSEHTALNRRQTLETRALIVLLGDHQSLFSSCGAEVRGHCPVSTWPSRNGSTDQKALASAPSSAMPSQPSIPDCAAVEWLLNSMIRHHNNLHAEAVDEPLDNFYEQLL